MSVEVHTEKQFDVTIIRGTMDQVVEVLEMAHSKNKRWVMFSKEPDGKAVAFDTFNLTKLEEIEEADAVFGG